MKIIKINPLKSEKGLLIRLINDNEIEPLITKQSFNWWLNHEIKDYIIEGYRIEYSDQKYDATEKKFI